MQVATPWPRRSRSPPDFNVRDYHPERCRPLVICDIRPDLCLPPVIFDSCPIVAGFPSSATTNAPITTGLALAITPFTTAPLWVSISSPELCIASSATRPDRLTPLFLTSNPTSVFLDLMALRGVWQLQKLVVSYCDWGGSSRGIRAFMETHLPSFKETNPQLEVVNELIRGQHPHLKASYKNHNQRVVCVKNLSPEDILLHATRLRNALGRKVIKLRTRHVTKHPSVQGTWSTALKL